MVSQFELSSRAALCRQLASQDAANQTVWMAEARSWSRLAAETLHDEHELKSGIVARFFFAFRVAAKHRPTNRPAEMIEMMKSGASISRSSL
ncbi:hypothetical protein GWG65_23095 [Bradyrhizobium sp. CSA207]|uniref:hypothetical protein n=1 Tax=Bradyrhizobium sp. CSA207 TaxID=2698826 RepID=UPI0023B1D7DD|nr:hypothetical protein [Bradyrhizobium sp. CSA207]MDE5444283.1 hypothetical protein [Bradyrhizobium sp. CSA207]